MEREYEKTITLSHDHANKLICYLLMTTNYRKGEREAWENLAAEMNADGAPRYPKAQSNADYWAELDRDLEAIRKAIDDAPLTLKK